MRFLVDENVPRQIGQFLQAEGHDVLILRDSDLGGAPDAKIWDHAVREQRIIVTQDRDFPLQERVDIPAGVILIRPQIHPPIRN